MSSFLALLLTYYTCSTMAEIRILTPTEAAVCSLHYREVKAWFLPLQSTGSLAGDNNAAYLGFKHWERENEDLVRDLRSTALDRVLGRSGSTQGARPYDL